MEVLKDFGVNPVLLVAQVINFLIIFFLLKRFLYKPVLDVLKKRQKEIDKGIEDAKRSHEILEEAEEREKRILKNARQKADETVKIARLQADEAIKEAEEKSKKQVEKMILDGQETIKQESEKAEKELMQKVGLLAVDMLEKSMTDLLDKNQQKLLLKKAGENLKNYKNE